MSGSQTPGTETVVIFSKGDAFALLDGGTRGTKLPVDELRKNLEAFISSLKTLLPSVTDAGGGFGLKSAEIAVGIDGKGHVGFLGTGVEVGAQATITLTFSR
jgi:hypothetical protein